MSCKILFTIYMILAVIFQATIASAQAESTEPPTRLATVPIIVDTKANVSAEALRHMQYKISEAVHVPLNDTLNWVEYIPDSEARSAFEEVHEELASNHKKLKLAEMMKPLAAKLNADLVVCTAIHRCHQYKMMTMRWGHGIHLVSVASVEMVIYDSRTDELQNKKASRSYNDDYSPRGTCEALAQECLMSLIEELQPRNKLVRYDRKKD